MKFHHVAFSVSDLSNSVDWYEKNLGFKKVQGIKRDFGAFALLSNDAGENIELIQHPDPVALPERRIEILSDIQEIGTKHLALEVDDIELTLEALKTNGVEQAREVGEAFYNAKYTFIKDPDGNLIELVELR